MQEDEGLNDLVASRAEAESAADAAAAPSDGTGSEASESAAPADSTEGSEMPAPVPVDDWRQNITREDWEETRRHAEVGRRFAPYAQDIDGLLRGGLRGQPQQSQAPQPVRPEPDELNEILGSKYAATLEALNSNPKLWETIVGGIDERRNGERRRKSDERMDRLEALVANLKAYNEEINPRRYATSPEWQQSGREFMELLTDGLREPEKAWERARKSAAKAGATPAQAAAAGDRAAAKVEASNASAASASHKSPQPTAGPATSKRPAPAADKTLSAAGRRPTGGGSVPARPKRRSVSKDYADATKLGAAALSKFGAS